jgi:DNA-binding MarR family transcriptional regulator
VDDSRDTASLSPEDTRITLGLLNAVEADSKLTQRSVASDLGIALGLANAYLKSCVRKGLVKVNQVPANRYAYYLTPKGFAEKSRLTAEYLTISFNFFRNARSECAAVLEECVRSNWRRVVLAGTGDLGEIAAMCAADLPIDLAGFYDPLTGEGRFAGMQVYRDLDGLRPFDAVVVTDFRDPQRMFDSLVLEVGAERVVAPALLAISRQPPVLME